MKKVLTFKTKKTDFKICVCCVIGRLFNLLDATKVDAIAAGDQLR